METCQYGKCQKEASVSGFILARNPNGDNDIPTKVVTCEEHKNVPGFFKD